MDQQAVAVPAAQPVTIHDLMAIGLGEMRMSVEQLLTTRLSHFLLALQGYRQTEETRYRQTAELVRLQTVELINIQLKPRNKIKHPSSLWPFPWDSVQTPDPASPSSEITPATIAAHINRLITAIDQ